NLPDSTVQAELRRRVRDALVARFGDVVRGTTLSERMQQLQAELRDRGFDVEVDTSGGLPVLREHNCPYSELATTDRDICGLEQDVFERVLGVPMRLAHCCQDEHHCCEFEIGEKS